jgi:CubicO group peptidase (beta-lactamase class C family)
VEASGRFGQKLYINPRRELVIVKLSATADQARRSTHAHGAVNAAARAVDSPAAFSSMVNAVLAGLPD